MTTHLLNTTLGSPSVELSRRFASVFNFDQVTPLVQALNQYR